MRADLCKQCSNYQCPLRRYYIGGINDCHVHVDLVGLEAVKDGNGVFRCNFRDSQEVGVDSAKEIHDLRGSV